MSSTNIYMVNVAGESALWEAETLLEAIDKAFEDWRQTTQYRRIKPHIPTLREEFVQELQSVELIGPLNK